MVAGLTKCVAVKANSKGNCQCERYGSLDSPVPGFKKLCEQENLPITVAGNQVTSAPRGRRMKRTKRTPGTPGQNQPVGSQAMEFPPLESLNQYDYGPDFFGLDGLLDPDVLMAHGVSAVAGAGGILAASMLNKVEFFADKPRAKAGTAIALGILGGRMLWMVGEGGQPDPMASTTRDAAMGFTGAVAGMGLASLLKSFMPELEVGLGAPEVATVPRYQFFDPTRGSVRDSQVEQVMVEQDDPLSLAAAYEQFNAPEVTDVELNGAWIG